MTDDNKETWLKDLKVGDLVIVKGLGLSRNAEAVEKVAAANKHTIAIGNRVYSRVTGYPKGRGKWDTEQLSEATPDELTRVRAKIRHSRLVRQLSSTLWDTWNSLTTEQLEACRNIVYPEKVGE